MEILPKLFGITCIAGGILFYLYFSNARIDKIYKRFKRRKNWQSRLINLVFGSPNILWHRFFGILPAVLIIVGVASLGLSVSVTLVVLAVITICLLAYSFVFE